MKLRRHMAAILAALILGVATLHGAPARGTAFSTDQSDLWWNNNESGWGIQFVQRGSAIFATMFVYGPTGLPTWYTATLESVGGLTWSGDLVVTVGPWFGTVPFNPGFVGIRKVGTMTWSAQLVQSGTLTYTVDGVAVSKSLIRQLIRYDDYNGTYLGAAHDTNTACFNPANNGTFEGYGVVSVVQNGLNVALSFANNVGGSCTFVGPLSQGGQFGQVSGAYSCTNGDIGTFILFELNVALNHLTARYNLSSSNFGCQTAGYLGGIRSR